MTKAPFLVVAYAAFLTVLATVPPGSGWLGQILLLLPTDLLDAFHAPAYGLLAWLSLSAFRRRGWPTAYAVIAGCLLAMTLGLWTEALQGPVSGRGPEVKDLLIDGIGVVTAALVALSSTTLTNIIPPKQSVTSYEHRKGPRT